MSRWYEVVLSPDDNDTWLVTVPEFPEVTTFGDAQPDACENGRKAIEEAISARIADGEDIPVPLRETLGKGRFVEISALTYLKCALYMFCRQQGVTRAELVRRLGWHREQVDRLFRLDHNSQLDQLEAAFRAIGIPLDFRPDFPMAA